MLYHLVLFKVIVPSSSSGEDYNNYKNKLNNFYNGLNSLRHIPGVIEVKFGEIEKTIYNDFADRTNGYTHSLLVKLNNKSSLEGYDKSALHNLIKTNILLPMVDKTKESPIMAVDWDDHISDKYNSLSSSLYSSNTLKWAGYISLLFLMGVITGVKLKSRL